VLCFPAWQSVLSLIYELVFAALNYRSVCSSPSHSKWTCCDLYCCVASACWRIPHRPPYCAFPVLQFVMLRVARRSQKADAVCLCDRCIRLTCEINWRRVVTGEAGNTSVVAFSRDLVWTNQHGTPPAYRALYIGMCGRVAVFCAGLQMYSASESLGLCCWPEWQRIT